MDLAKMVGLEKQGTEWSLETSTAMPFGALRLAPGPEGVSRRVSDRGSDETTTILRATSRLQILNRPRQLSWLYRAP
jgi:hypothetical protein